MGDGSEAQKRAAKNLIDKIESSISVDSFINNTTALEQLKTAVLKASSTNLADGGTQKKSDEEYKNYTQSFINRVKSLLSSKEEYKEANLELEKLLKKYQSSKGTLEENTKNGFIYRVVLNKILGQNNLPKLYTLGKNSYIQALSGYYYETGVRKILKDQVAPQLEKIGINKNARDNFVISSGKWLTGDGKQAPEDLLFNVFFGGNTNTIKTIFNRDYQTTIPLNENQITEPLERAGQELFGAQVKSFTLTTPRGRIKPFHPIGARGGLFIQYQLSQYGKLGLVGSIGFLGLQNNIIQALGQNNLMFIDGSRSYWMSDYIAHFRDLKFYLSFEQEKNKDQLIMKPHVALYNYIGTKRHYEDEFYV